jgi:hypothetical protein
MRTRICVAALLLASACESEHPAAQAVRGYNGAIVQAYRESNPELMAPWATEREKTKILVLIDLKKASRLVLESEVLEQRTVNVTQQNNDMAVVETEELWTYHDRPLDPGQPAGDTFKARMWMRWEVLKENGKYKVDKGRTLRSEYLEPAGYRPHFGRAATAHTEKTP